MSSIGSVCCGIRSPVSRLPVAYPVMVLSRVVPRGIPAPCRRVSSFVVGPLRSLCSPVCPVVMCKGFSPKGPPGYQPSGGWPPQRWYARSRPPLPPRPTYAPLPPSTPPYPPQPPPIPPLSPPLPPPTPPTPPYPPQPPPTPPPTSPPLPPPPTSPPYLRLASLDRRLASLDAGASTRTPLK